MRPAMVSVAPALWLACWCLLVAGQEDPRQPCSPQPGSPNCPRPTKSAPLVPSFTKTTPPQKHTTTTHHHRRHTTTTAAPANHTTHHSATTTARKPTTTRHVLTTTTAHHRPVTTAATSPRPTTAHGKPTTPHHRTVVTTAARPTSRPKTTTTAAPVPTPPPAVPVGNYTVKRGSAVCLRAEMGLRLEIRYGDQAKRQLWGSFTVQPNHTDVSGSCSDKAATLKLRFPEGFLLFAFTKNETQKTAYLSQVQGNLTYQFPGATEKTFRADNGSLQEFAAPLGKSYQCRNRSVALSEDFRLTALRERVQAFQLQGGKFGEAEVCPEQRRSVVLPIVVGVVLGVLILIVLVAFAVGRWRGRTGYESL